MTAPSRNPNLYTALLGFALWLIALFRFVQQPNLLSQLELLLLLGITVIVPLSLRLTAQPDRDGIYPLLYRALTITQPFVSVLTLLSFTLSNPVIVTVFSLGWLAQSALISLYGLARLLPRSHTPVALWCVDVGLMYTAVSGIWFFAYQINFALLGFDPIIVILTGVHFVYISLAALPIAGMIGLVLPDSGQRAGMIYRTAARVLIAAPVVVALGITFSLTLEVIGVVMLVVSLLVIALIGLIVTIPTVKQTVAKGLVFISTGLLFITMGMALAYALGRWTDWWLLSIPRMANVHGWLNAVGFAVVGLIGWNWGNVRWE